MRQKLLNNWFPLLMALAAIASVVLVFNVFKTQADYNELSKSYSQLLQENAELQVEYYKVKIQLDELVDSIWSDNNRRMKEDAN